MTLYLELHSLNPPSPLLEQLPELIISDYDILLLYVESPLKGLLKPHEYEFFTYLPAEKVEKKSKLHVFFQREKEREVLLCDMIDFKLRIIFVLFFNEFRFWLGGDPRDYDDRK